MAKADFVTREKLIHLLVNSVTLLPNKGIIHGNIPVTNLDVLSPPLARDGLCISLHKAIALVTNWKQNYLNLTLNSCKVFR